MNGLWLVPGTAMSSRRYRKMKQYTFSIAASGLILAAVCGTAQAAAVTPLQQAIANDAAASNVTAVRYYHYRHHYCSRHGGPVGSYWSYYRVGWLGRGGEPLSIGTRSVSDAEGGRYC
jgi:hypothetical protein